jgi:TonB family protein
LRHDFNMTIASSQILSQPKNQNHLFWALLLSVLIHLLFVFIFKLPSSSPAPAPLEITLYPITKHQKQIVSPSEAKPVDIPVESNLLSDKNTFTKIESIKHGIEDAGVNTPPTQASKTINPSSKQPTPTKQKAEAHAPTLKLKPIEINNQLASISRGATDTETKQADNKQENKVSDTERETQFQSAVPFRVLSLPGTQLGQRGISDVLPTIQDGDVTLLNTKADQYAVFVRRIALQVFGGLRKHSWQNVSRGELRRIENYAIVEAIMSKQGKLIRSELLQSSGSPLFDRALIDSVKDGAWDQNPPAGAESVDSNIHFYFQARTWSQLAPNGANERRWIRLGTGLK